MKATKTCGTEIDVILDCLIFSNDAKILINWRQNMLCDVHGSDYLLSRSTDLKQTSNVDSKWNPMLRVSVRKKWYTTIFILQWSHLQKIKLGKVWLKTLSKQIKSRAGILILVEVYFVQTLLSNSMYILIQNVCVLYLIGGWSWCCFFYKL